MKKTLVIVAVLVFVGGVVAAVFLLQRAGNQRHSESRFDSAVVELGLSLQAPAESADPDTPIFLNLGLASPRVINLMAHEELDPLRGLPDLSFGGTDSPWWSGIELVARSGDDERDLPLTPLPGGAQPVADLSNGFGISVGGVVKSGDLDLRGSVQLQAKMRWKADTIRSNIVNLRMTSDGVDAITKAVLLANFHLEMENVQEAKSWVEELLSLQPREPNTHALLARVLEETGDLEGAQRSWVRAIELLPEDLGEPPEIYFARLRAVEARLASAASADRSR